MELKMDVINASWPQKHGVTAFTTMRRGVEGKKLTAYAKFNMGLHVGDNAVQVLENRAELMRYMGINHAQWLNQVHGIECIEATKNAGVITADACWTSDDDLACIAMTADCLPVAFRDNEKVAVAHAGWRGLLDGVLESSLKHFSLKHTDIWLGPAIGPRSFEVGGEVRDAFMERDDCDAAAFTPSVNTGKWLADIYLLAKNRLMKQGILSENIYGGEYCTLEDNERFYSYRRENITGRMATVIYKNS